MAVRSVHQISQAKTLVNKAPLLIRQDSQLSTIDDLKGKMDLFQSDLWGDRSGEILNLNRCLIKLSVIMRKYPLMHSFAERWIFFGPL